MRKGCACLIDELTDISDVQNLLNFIRFYAMEKRMTVSRFVNTCDVLGESETTSADALSIFLGLRNVLENNLGLNLEELIGLCSDGASVMNGKDNGVAASFKLEECSGILSEHCICHCLTKFISDFKTMTQLWTSQIYKTATRLKEFEDLPQAQQRSLVRKVKKAV